MADKCIFDSGVTFLKMKKFSQKSQAYFPPCLEFGHMAKAKAVFSGDQDNQG